MAHLMRFRRAIRTSSVVIVLVAIATISTVGGQSAATAIPTFSSRAAIYQTFGKLYHVTPVLDFHGGKWVLVGRQPYGLSGLRVLIFDLVDSRWIEVDNTYFKENQVGNFDNGDKYSRNELSLASLTGSDNPDVVVRSTGADYGWFSVISDVGGKWHLVRFDYATKPTIAIDAFGVQGHFVIAETDTCEFSCAGGPVTYAWYRFNGSEFVPTQPPSTPALCTSRLLTSVVRGDGSNDVTLTRVDCQDGWAVGAGEGKNGRATGVFEQIKSKWVELAFNDSGSADDLYKHSYAGYYGFAIPYSLTVQLCHGVGESAKWVIAAPMSKTAYQTYQKLGLFPR